MISRKHRTIFVHVPKCAGQSVEIAFLADNGLTWETRAPLLLRPNSDPRAGPPRLAHLIARDYVACGHVTAEEFDAFYTFAIVRNPWARTVSLYRHLEPNIAFASFVHEWLAAQLGEERAPNRWFVRPQVEFVTDDGRTAVKDILHLENLAQEFPRAAARAGLQSALPHVNRQGERTRPDIERRPSQIRKLADALKAAVTPKRFEAHASWRDYFGPQEVAAVARLYAADCATFGYSFERDGPAQ